MPLSFPTSGYPSVLKYKQKNHLLNLEKYKAKTKEWAKCPIQCAQYPLYEILRAGNFVL